MNGPRTLDDWLAVIGLVLVLFVLPLLTACGGGEPDEEQTQQCELQQREQQPERQQPVSSYDPCR